MRHRTDQIVTLAKKKKHNAQTQVDIYFQTLSTLKHDSDQCARRCSKYAGTRPIGPDHVSVSKPWWSWLAW